ICRATTKVAAKWKKVLKDRCGIEAKTRKCACSSVCVRNDASSRAVAAQGLQRGAPFVAEFVRIRSSRSPRPHDFGYVRGAHVWPKRSRAGSLLHDLFLFGRRHVVDFALEGLRQFLDLLLGLVALVFGAGLLLLGGVGVLVAVAADIADRDPGLFGQFLH